MSTDYNKQATDFLEKYNTKFEAVQCVPQKAPRWAKDNKHGINWYITLTNVKGSIGFDFWDNIANKEVIDKHNEHSLHKMKYKAPCAYSVLAGLFTGCIDDFGGFCSAFGYDTDSKEAESIFNECNALDKKLVSIFSAEAIEDLRDIN